MGCGTSQATSSSGGKKLMNPKKPSIFFIAGGPGSEKGKVCEAMIRDYKFKYLSSYEIIQFEQQRGGPDADLINQFFKEKKTLPSDLIVRLVKKAIASCGVRRFLIDGFPNSVEDIEQFKKQLKSTEVEFNGYLDIRISEQKMIESGISAKTFEKQKHHSGQIDKSEIQEEVKKVVKSYLEETSKIKEEYEKIGKYILIDGEKGPDSAYQYLKSYFQVKNIVPPQPIQVFFAHFDDPDVQNMLCDDLVRKYGLYFYTPTDMINETMMKPNSSEADFVRKCKKQNKQIPSNFVLSLIKKKIQKHDFEGTFLISGYPRSISDAMEWDKTFGWETNIEGYLSFQIPNQKFRQFFTKKMKKYEPNIKQQEINKKFAIYQQGQGKICEHYEQKQILLKIQSDEKNICLNKIHQFFSKKNYPSKSKISPQKLVFLSDIVGNGQKFINIVNEKNKKVKTIQMQEIYKKCIEENSLYSELIDSFKKIGKPVSGPVAVKILYNQLLALKTDRMIIVQGFPNSVHQQQIWDEQIGEYIELLGIVLTKIDHKQIETKIKQNIKSGKIQNTQFDAMKLTKENATQLQQRISASDHNTLVMSQQMSQKEIINFIQKIKLI